MNPQNAVSPSNRLREGTLNVIYTAPDGSWSLATMIWDKEECVGCRWNGDINDPDDKGNPTSRGRGTWFILPGAIGRPIADLVEAFSPRA
ncbi:hypothetical protein [Flavisphingomonas formosensis]|uniref:hypothetical protein n=1 Tax=Flavisphingomonas formosensis TaxID=861534 RepID=UPI001E4BF06C|nr:hypothetical protein [Sphingomonas formosensis]